VTEERLVEVWQAEWCPHSARVRQRLTELGVDFVARQVDAYPDERGRLCEATSVASIPVVVFPDGETVGGADEDILAAIDRRYADGAGTAEHIERAAEHGRPAVGRTAEFVAR
jgi:glutaredoxin